MENNYNDLTFSTNEEGNTFTIHNGKNILLKRKQLEKYLENKSYI